MGLRPVLERAAAPLLSLFGSGGRVGVGDLDAEIRQAEIRRRTAFGPALEAADKRLERLQRIKAMTENLAVLEIRRPDVEPLRELAVERLLAGAGEGNPITLRLNPEVIACGTMPGVTVASGTATSIGGSLPG